MKTRNRNYKINIFILTFTFGLMFCVVGCKGDKKQTSTPPNVTVSKVIKKTVPIYYEYVGNTESVRTVDITARVEGFLIERAFEDGQDVKQRDLLFVIDPRSFEASLEQSKAQLERDKASLNYALQQVVRYKPLVEKDYITKDNYEEYKTQAAEAAATVEADEAAVIQATTSREIFETATRLVWRRCGANWSLPHASSDRSRPRICWHASTGRMS